MADIIITRSRRGLFNIEEWETFAGPNGDGPNDTRVFFRCRNPSCWRIWTMEQFAYRAIDIESNPIQCAECGSYDITATWCNVKERPYTWIGPPNHKSNITDYFKALKDYRKDHDGLDPSHSSSTFINVASNIWINYPPQANYSRAQYFEVFHTKLPTLQDTNFYSGNSAASKWTDIPEDEYYVKNNKNFYRCIINMVIQTEHTGGTGGSG